LGKTPFSVDAKELKVLADVLSPGVAKAAGAAGNVGVYGHPVTNHQIVDASSYFHHIAGTFVA
jgi:hypothetical protein